MMISAAGALVAAYLVYTLINKEDDDAKPKQSAQRSAPAHQHNAFSTKTVEQTSSGKKNKQRGKNDKTV
jgi:hypothetical protein